MSESNTGFRAPFNVVAAFSQGDDASVAVDVLAARGVPRPAITVHRPDEGATGDDGADGRTRRRGGEPDTDVQLAVERVLVALHVCDSELAGRTAALLRALGAERVDLVDARGTPLPPQAQHPRPEDPKGWGRAGYG